MSALASVLWMYPLLFLLWLLLDGITGHHHSERDWVMPLCVTAGMVLGELSKVLTVGKTLQLTEDSLVIQSRPWLVLRRHSYETRLMSKLRFVPKDRGYELVNRDHQSELQFNLDSEPENFFVGIAESEAIALIAKMMEVYRFPKDLPHEKQISAETSSLP
jgi:hypothetical protein